MDWLPTMFCETFYIQGEISYPPFHSRVMAMGKNFNVPPGVLRFQTRFGVKLDSAKDSQWFINEVRKVHPKVVIIDPLYKFMTSRGEEHISRTLDTLDQLIEQVQCSVVVITHSRKPKTDYRGQAVDMGAVKFPALCWNNGQTA